MRILCVAAVSLLASNLLAQNIKSDKVDVKYLVPPLKPLDKSIKTYRVSVELLSLADGDSREYMTNAFARNAVPTGYSLNEVREGADLEIYVRLEGFQVQSEKVSREELQFKKDDKTIVKKNVFVATFEYAFPLFFRLRDLKADRLIFEGYILDSNTWHPEKTGQENSQDDAEGAMDKLMYSSKRKLFDQNVSYLKNLVESEFSFFSREERWPIYFVESSKKENYDDVMAARYETIKCASLMTHATVELGEELRSQLAVAIEKWKAILIESNIEDKKARIDKKVTQAVMQNLANCYFYQRNFSEAERYSQAPGR